MARVGLHGRVQAAARYVDAIPILEWLFDQIENTLNGQVDSANIAAGGVGTTQLADSSVTTAKLGAQAVTSLNVDSTVAKIATGQYTGDGTVSREINIGLRARHVTILRHDNATRFEAWGSTSTAFARIQTTAAGVTSDGGTDFAGTSAAGFTLGSAAGGGTSNAAGITYSYVALG